MTSTNIPIRIEQHSQIFKKLIYGIRFSTMTNTLLIQTQFHFDLDVVYLISSGFNKIF